MFKGKSLIVFLQITFASMFILFLILQITNITLGSDDAFIATIAKNLAFGYGYASSYGEIIKFDPGITTGFPIILPVALVIKIFSNKYWVPSVSAALIFDILFLIVLSLPQKFEFINEKKLWIWRNLILGFIIFSSALQSQSDPYINMTSSLLGEAPCMLLIVIYTFLLIIAKDRKLFYFISGLVASLAVATKFLALISIVPIFLIYLFLICKSFNDIKTKIPHIIVFLVGFAIPIGIFELCKVISLHGFSAYSQLKIEELKFFQQTNSTLKVNIFRIIREFFVKYFYIIEQINIIRFLLFLFFPLFFIWKVLKREIPNNFMPITLLMSASFINLVWWLICGNQNLRYIIIGWFLFLFALSMSIFIINNKNKYFYMTIILIFLILAPSLRVNTYMLKNYKDQKAAKDFILEHKYYEYCGCWIWGNRRLEYLLPTVNNFSDCWNITKYNPQTVLVRDIKYWALLHFEAIDYIKSRCEKNTIFKNDAYVISACGK